MASAKQTIHKEDQKEVRQMELLDPNSSMKHIAYWESSLFSSVYLRNDLKRDFSEKWEKDFDDVVFDEDGNTIKSGFYHFYNEFRNIADSLRAFSRKNLSETDTITKVIVPLLDALGWFDNCFNNVEEPYAAETSFTIKSTPKNKTYRTDILLVNYPQEANFIGTPKDSEQRKKEARQYTIAPLEAKYWNRILDKEKSNKREDKKRANKAKDDVGISSSFNEQILAYMDVLHKKWGIISDGNIWRLVNSELSKEDPQRCFEFRIQALLDQEQKVEVGGADELEFMENAKMFYLMFGKPSFVKDDTGKVFLDEVLKESRKYIDQIEEDLKDRFIAAMNLTCNGLLRAAKESGTIKSPDEEDLKLIRTVAESKLFNILFIKSCEARSILPIKSPSYYKISLTSIMDRISVFDPEKYVSSKDREYINMRLAKSLNGHKFKPSGNNLYKNLIRLTEVIHDGADKEGFGFEIKGFKESIFSKREWNFSKKHQLTDEEMVSILFELGYSKATSSIQRNYQQIPYNYFTPRQLGSIYESFLEFKLDITKEPMAFVPKGKSRQWIKLTANVQKKLKGHEPIVSKGQAFFTPDNKERKEFGSYYTPDYIVQYIVKDTLGPYCHGKGSNEILNIRVCDPAMGSGHFLIGALNFLTNEYVKALENEVEESAIPSKEEVKRIVLDRCIFGVDINPRAVKLAKMSLWLESAHWGKKLERLDDQLFEHDTLKLEHPIVDGITAYIGNPPWVLKRDSEISNEYREYLNQNFRSAEGFKKNLFPLFLERICRWDGKFSVNLVLPNRLLDTPSYSRTREIAFKSFSDVKVTALPEGSFDNVTASYITLLLSNLEKSSGEIKVFDFGASVPKLKYSLNNLGEDFKVNINRDKNLVPFIEKLESISTPLVDDYFCHVGMMVKDNKNQFSKTKSSTKKVRIVKGHCLDKLDLAFTYYFDPESVTVFGGTKRKEKHCHTPKLLVRKTGDFILASADLNSSSPVYAEQSVYMVIPKNPKATSSIEIINIYLNTMIPTIYFRNELITNPDSYPYIQQYDLEQIPVPKALYTDKKLIAGVKKLVGSSKDKQKNLAKVADYLCEKLNLPIGKDKLKEAA